MSSKASSMDSCLLWGEKANFSINFVSLKIEQIYFLQLYEMYLNIFSFTVIIYTFLLKQIEILSAKYSSASVVFQATMSFSTHVFTLSDIPTSPCKL